MAMDWAEQQARKALQQYRKGSQISAGCVEIYDAVACAIRDAYKRGEQEAGRCYAAERDDLVSVESMITKRAR